jgi:hypothetical protein
MLGMRIVDLAMRSGTLKLSRYARFRDARRIMTKYWRKRIKKVKDVFHYKATYHKSWPDLKL